ncbi:MAG: hypothetical protein EOO54_10285 [Haliea sp.]|nr:MAG: hypothetical protein EOO54_10285 [Haliea sp.]
MTSIFSHPIRTALLALALGATAAFAQGAQTWFTVLGDPDDPLANTIQVNPVPLSIEGEQRTMKVRVNRSAQRRNWDGLPYRSYESVVLFNCVNHTARYLAADFYLEPGWKGDVVRATYPQEPIRAMAFRDVEPNPTLRIMRAACSTGRGAGNQN